MPRKSLKLNRRKSNSTLVKKTQTQTQKLRRTKSLASISKKKKGVRFRKKLANIKVMSPDSKRYANVVPDGPEYLNELAKEKREQLLKQIVPDANAKKKSQQEMALKKKQNQSEMKKKASRRAPNPAKLRRALNSNSNSSNSNTWN